QGEPQRNDPARFPEIENAQLDQRAVEHAAQREHRHQQLALTAPRADQQQVDDKNNERDQQPAAVPTQYAVAQIKLPQAQEIIVVAQFSEVAGRMAEVVVPQAQGFCVVQPEIFHVQQVHVGVIADDFQHSGDGRQGAARKDVPLNEVDAAFCLLVSLLSDRDRLQQHQAVVLEQLRALLEIGPQKT
nr:hypothetical protein [Tanacetum cinerariifolium]